jgi:probable rRNA maturation factor
MILLDPDLDPDPAPKSHSAEISLFSASYRRGLARFLTEAQSAVRVRGQVSVLLTTDATIRDLNQRFRGHDKPTDVLSFPAVLLQNAKPAERVAGDLAISVDTARRQAAASGHSLRAEIRILTLHGLLHLAGYDHQTDDGAMARRELHLRSHLGLPQGLIERAGSGSAHMQVSKSARRGAAHTLSHRGKRFSKASRRRKP